MDSHSRRPPLSILVPNSLSIRSDLPSAEKQKRLFPIACRVVPTDQWFTTRIDRTWNVKDLKVWLLSKALPPHVLPLPASYRPSSPVTFAAAPPSTAIEITTATAYSATLSFDDDTVVVETPDDDHGLSSDPNSQTRRDLNPSQPIHFSYKTGAPAISGIEALKHRHSCPSLALAHAFADNPELVQSALQIADRWSLYSFSMGGMLLVDSSPLSEYSLNPNELLELHRAGAYVPLPRIIQPPLPDPMHFPTGSGYTRTASARAAASFTSNRPNPGKPLKSKSVHKNRKHVLRTEANLIPTSSSSPLASSHLHGHGHGQLSSTSSEYDSDQDIEEFEEIYGSPYAQPYFDSWAMVLRIRKPSSSKKGTDKGKGREEEDGVSRCECVEPLGPGTNPTGTETWKKMWVTVREGRISIRRQRGDEEEESWFVGNCVGLYGVDKLKYLLGHDPPQTGLIHHQSHHHRPQTSSTYHAPSEPSVYRSSTNISRKFIGRGKDLTICAKFTEDSEGGSRWLFLNMLDPESHEHLLRIIHRLAYTSPLRLPSIYPNPLRHSSNHSISQSLSQSVDFSSLTSLAPPQFRPTTHTMRTLRTEFLPNPIPHPLALSFSPPSLSGQGDVSDDDDLPIFGGGGRRRSLFDTSDFASGDETYGDDSEVISNASHAPPTVSFTQPSYGMGLGPGMGVRFPEWREEVLIIATNAGLGGGVGMSSLNKREYVPYDRYLGKLDINKEDNEDDANGTRSGTRRKFGYRRSPAPFPAQGSSTSSIFRKASSSLGETVVEDDDRDALGVLDGTDSDSDSEAGSEKEWEGWAYDLDRLKGVRYPKTQTRHGAGGGGGGCGGGSDEDHEHYRYHEISTTTKFPATVTAAAAVTATNQKKVRRSIGRRDRAKTIAATGATPSTPMSTPIVPPSGDEKPFSAFRLQQQQQHQPISPTNTVVTSSTTLSSNSTVTPRHEHEHDDSSSLRQSEGEGGNVRPGPESSSFITPVSSSSPSSTSTSSASVSPSTRVRSATVSTVRSLAASSSSNVQVRQPPVPPPLKAKYSSSGVGSDRTRTGEDSRSIVGSGSGSGPSSGTGAGTGIGMKNLMRGLSVKAGKESLIKGLENALDFVEGK